MAQTRLFRVFGAASASPHILTKWKNAERIVVEQRMLIETNKKALFLVIHFARGHNHIQRHVMLCARNGVHDLLVKSNTLILMTSTKRLR